MMKSAVSEILIEVDALRVGMFVHLEGGWMSHPFPLSNFRLTSDEQVMTIRSLGVRRVRWSPNQSDSVVAAGVNKAHAPSPGHPNRLTATVSIGAAPGARSDLATSTLPLATIAPDLPLTSTTTATSTTAATTATTSAPATPALLAESADAALRREKLAVQRAALIMCEQQFAEAACEYKKLVESVLTKPSESRDKANALTRTLLGKMFGEHEQCIRLLSEGVGDKASTHALNVTVISMLMGRAFGLPAPDMMDLGLGAMLHDIGKIELAERVRHREDHFSSAESRAYEEHVARGVAVARTMNLSAGATLVIAQHHEYADGSGFPARLNSDRMTAAARIVALVNRYDNLCNPHLPSKALTPHESVSLLFAQGKSKFDTTILATFIRMMGVYPAGSTVQLTDDRYAMVVSVNSSRPLKPRVLVREAGVAREDALILDLETAQGLGIRRCLKPLQLPEAELDYLAPRQRVTYFFEPVMEALHAA